MNNSGHITLPACLLTFFMTCILLIMTLHSLKTYHSIKTRIGTYLCYREQNKYLSQYVSKIASLNNIIKIAYIARLIPNPTTSRIADATIKAAKITQNTIHISYMKNISSSTYCSWSNKAFYLKNLPYKMVLALSFKRNSKGTTIVRKKKWTNLLNSKSQSKHNYFGFLIKVNYSLKNQYSKSVKKKVREIQMSKEMLNLNFAFGSESFF